MCIMLQLGLTHSSCVVHLFTFCVIFCGSNPEILFSSYTCLLTQHSVKTMKGNWRIHLTTKQRWIPFFMMFILLVGCTGSVTTAYTSATLNSLEQILQDYFRCESAGRQMNCSNEEVVN